MKESIHSVFIMIKLLLASVKMLIKPVMTVIKFRVIKK